MVTRQAIAREQASVERFQAAVHRTSFGHAQAVVEPRHSGSKTVFDVRIERIPSHGPPLTIRRLEGLSRLNLDITSTLFEALAEVQVH